ncbi:MAG TPA: dihydrolipoyl dehydrogenase [Verrucomicrobiae bacterium]|nr:dihydrolipoyl dehydrogenase [Verrucomicrobiae bacterium]
MDSIQTEILVLGAGPGGYAAAFYAADKGKKVTLVEQEDRLGGVCLIRGCIPSKALLHAAKLITETREAGHMGLQFEPPKIDLEKLRAWKNSVIDKLAGGVATLAKQRNVEVLHGRGYFEDSKTLRVETPEGQKFVTYDSAIVAVGSKSAMPKAFDLGNPRIMTSRQALDVPDIPGTLLVVGGGYIGMELGTVYATLGSKVVVVEALGAILTGADADLVRPVQRYAERAFKEVRVKTRVLSMATAGKQIKVVMEFDGKKVEELYDRVLVSVGRVPNHADLGLQNTKITKDDRGFIKVNEKQQTNDPSLYAIGDIAGGVLLAHKAAREARVAVDAILGEFETLDKYIVPAVVFTDPEIAWCGLSETEAKERGITVKIARFPWGASGRALTLDRPEGLTKLIIDPETERLLGVGITGQGAGELISEAVLAIEMGATAYDLASSIHPHPTLSETLMECAEVFYGHATHTYTRREASHRES